MIPEAPENAATGNFVTHATWAAERIALARVESTPRLTIVDSGLDTDTFNIVCAADLSEGDVAPAVAQVVERFRGSGRPFSWWVAPGDRPTDLADRLEACGLVRSESELAMAAGLALERPRLASASHVTLEPVRTTADLAAYARINAENWDPPDPAVEEFYRRSAADLLGGQSPFRFHLARREGTPVAGVEITLRAGVAGVYGLSTRAAYRGRGIASALLESALAGAQAEGAHVAVLQAAPAGVGIYRRLGFAEFGRITELKPHRP